MSLLVMFDEGAGDRGVEGVDEVLVAAVIVGC